MATESMKGLREALAAWNCQDTEAVMEYVNEDVVWRTGGQIPDLEAVYEGRDGVRRFFEQFVEPWEEISIEIEDVLDDREDQIFCIVNFHATGRGGIEVEGRFFQIYRYDDQHRVVWFQAFPEDAEEEARREAGVSG
jgi:ketosteroid isomerase-like protein